VFGLRVVLNTIAVLGVRGFMVLAVLILGGIGLYAHFDDGPVNQGDRAVINERAKNAVVGDLYEATISSEAGVSCVITPASLTVKRGDKITFKSATRVAVGAPTDHVEDFVHLVEVDGSYQVTVPVDEAGPFECDDEQFLEQFNALRSGNDAAKIAQLNDAYSHGLLTVSFG